MVENHHPLVVEGTSYIDNNADPTDPRQGWTTVGSPPPIQVDPQDEDDPAYLDEPGPSIPAPEPALSAENLNNPYRDASDSSRFAPTRTPSGRRVSDTPGCATASDPMDSDFVDRIHEKFLKNRRAVVGWMKTVAGWGDERGEANVGSLHALAEQVAKEGKLPPACVRTAARKLERDRNALETHREMYGAEADKIEVKTSR